MRVMTWNVWWRFGDWEARQAALERVVCDVGPDVLCLQEVWSEDGDSVAHRLARALLGRDEVDGHVALSDDAYAERRDRRPGFHNAIVSPHPLADAISHPLPGGDGRPGVRRALSATVLVDGHTWPVVSTHLAYRFDESALREAQCREILAVVAGVRGDPTADPPVVVAGDFNAVPDSDEIRLLTGRRAGPVANLVLSDSWEQVGDGGGATWRSDNPYQAHTAWPDRRLDYVFVSWPRPKPMGNPAAARLVGVDPVATPAGAIVPSDHAAVVVDLHP